MDNRRKWDNMQNAQRKISINQESYIQESLYSKIKAKMVLEKKKQGDNFLLAHQSYKKF